MDRHQALFLDARPPQAEVAIVYNPLSHFVGGRQRATAYGGPQGEVAGIERDSLLGVHRALFGQNVPVDYVHINHLSAARLAPYKLVFFPYPIMIPEASARVFREYVEKGGVLVAEARLAWNNERGSASDRIPGLGLAELMGAREVAVTTARNGRTEIRWTEAALPGMKPGDVLPARWYEETLEPLSPRSRVVATFADGLPAAVVSNFGAGRTLLLGSYVSAAYQSTPTPAGERFFAGLLEWAGASVPVGVAGSPLEVRFLEAGDTTLLFAFNHERAAAASRVTLRKLAGHYTATDLVTDRSVGVESTADGVRVELTVDPAAVRVLTIRRR